VRPIGGAGNSLLTLNRLAALSTRTAQVTVTRFHGIEATVGDIGSSTNPINVELVASPGRPEHLYAAAGANVFLNLTGLLRDDLAPGEVFQVNTDFVTAGANANVVMQASMQESGSGSAGGRLVPRPPRGAPPALPAVLHPH